jgi:hypothetical protein
LAGLGKDLFLFEEEFFFSLSLFKIIDININIYIYFFASKSSTTIAQAMQVLYMQFNSLLEMARHLR